MLQIFFGVKIIYLRKSNFKIVYKSNRLGPIPHRHWEQTLGTSGEPLFSETGWFSSQSSSAICLLPVSDQFSAFVSDPSNPLKATIEEEEKDGALLPYRRNAFPWCFSRCSPNLDTSGSWCQVMYTKDIGQSPRHPLGCRAPELVLKGLSELNLSLSKSVPHNKQLFKILQW